MSEIDDVLRFWFDEAGPDRWFANDAAFDRAIAERFREVYDAAAAGGLATWRESAEGCLALCIVLDQFPRNMFRGTAQAYAADPLARGVALYAVDRGLDLSLIPGHRVFVYLPFEHSEDIEDQRLAVRLIRERTDNPEWLDYAERHLRVVERFGRFPHRNAILGRPSTPAEIAFLKEPGSSF